MKKRYSVFASVLAASLLMPATAFAANPIIEIERQTGSNEAYVYLSGIDTDITSVEITLQPKQGASNIHFTGAEDTTYHFHSEKNGLYTIYVDAYTPLEKNNDRILLGNFVLDNMDTFSGASKLIVLDENENATTYTNVSLQDNVVLEKPGNGNNNNHTDDDTDDTENNTNQKPSGSGGSSGNGGNSQNSQNNQSNQTSNSVSNTGKPTIVGNQINGSIIVGEDGSVSIHPHAGYQVQDVLVNGISQGAVLQLLNLKADDQVEVIFAAVQQSNEIDATLPTKFIDVPITQWYAQPVSYVTQRGLFSGISETEFAPMHNMTRAMLVSVLYRLEGAKDQTKSTFTDVVEDAWYANAVGWAHTNQLVSGISETEFAPNTPITREQAAVMLARYLKYAGVSLENSNTSFVDNAEISAYAKESVGAMQQAGLLSGDDMGNFRPKAEITRAEISSIFTRLCQRYGI